MGGADGPERRSFHTVHFRPEYLQAVERLCHEHDVLMVADEVQTGFGVTGSNWACQQLGVRPDVIAFARAATLGEEDLLLLPCGPDGLRFRPALTVSAAELTDALGRLDRVLGWLAGQAPVQVTGLAA